MLTSFLEALAQPFFLRSLFTLLLLALVFPLYGNIVVVRQEANIAHTFAHIGLFGVAVGLWFDRSIEASILGSVVISVVFLYLLGRTTNSNHVAHNEIGAQLGLVGAILIVSNMTGYRADITSYLFGDILLLGTSDIYVVLGIVSVCILLYVLFGKQWYAISLQQSLAKSKHISLTRAYLTYLIALGLLIGGAMKIVGVLLVSAFLILPSNIGKLLAHNKRQWNSISIGICCVGGICALFLSWYRDLPSGASIIALLIGVFFCLTTRKKIASK